MAASTCPHPYPNTCTVASERNAFLFDAEHRCGLSANICFSYRCELLAAGTVTIGLVEAKRDAEKLPRAIKRSALKVLDKAIAAISQLYRLISTILRETGTRE